MQAHFPSICLALFVVYIPAFISSYISGPPLDIVEDDIDITVKEKSVIPEDAEPSNNGTAEAATPAIISEKINIRETLVVEERIEKPWKILAYGYPNSARPKLSLATLLVNVVLMLLMGDALYRARWLHQAEDLSFARLGFVSPSEAKFTLREASQAKLPITVEVRARDPRRPTGISAWRSKAVIKQTSNATDFVETVTVSLKDSKQRWYEWKTSNNHSGEFLSPPKAGSLPSENDGKFTFLSTSCILSQFPYNPFDDALAIPGLRHLAKKLPDMGAQFMLFLGDFIYVDVPERFGKTSDEYRMQYRQVYASPDWSPVAQNLSWIHVLDDHEISNDWSSNTTGLYSSALAPWLSYQADANPPRAAKAGTRSRRGKEATWFEFTQGPASFFMMDTRSYRSSNNAPFEDPDKTMLGPEQLVDFLAWLARPEPKGVHWKFVATSVPFTKNWPVNVKDTWGGFLVERRRLLEAMWDAGARGASVVLLSGDRHEFAATKFPPPPGSKWPASAAAHEFSTSPLNQFASPFPTYRQTDDEDVKLK